MPELPNMSGRLVFWEHADSVLGRSWAKWFLGRIRRDESTGAMDWTQRGLLAEQAVFVESLAELRRVVENRPASFVFAEVTASRFRELIGHIPQLRRMVPLLRIAVVCLDLPERPVDESNAFDSLFREAGATTVLATQRDLLAMLPVVLTHFANLPPEETNWREAVEQRLPWRNRE